MSLGLRGSKGVAAAPFTAGPYTWDQFVTFSAGLGGTNTIGKCFYVDPRGTEYGLGNNQNSGTSWSEPLATIQAAVNKCVDKRGDYIFVGAGANAKNTAHWTGTSEHPDYQKIKENVLIYDKSNVHIIAVPFKSVWSHQMRPSDGAGNYLEAYPGTRTTYSISAGAVSASNVGFVVMSRDVEITGFCIDVGGGMVGIYIGDGAIISTVLDEDGNPETGANAAGTWIHDNIITGGSEGTTGAGIVIEGCSGDVIIENNTIELCGGFGIFTYPGSDKTNQRPLIRGNTFNDNKGYGIYASADLTTRGLTIDNNVFLDGDNQMTAGIKTGICLHTLVSNNRFGCTTPLDLTTTDFFSGNYKCTTGTATETYIEEE